MESNIIKIIGLISFVPVGPSMEKMIFLFNIIFLKVRRQKICGRDGRCYVSSSCVDPIENDLDLVVEVVSSQDCVNLFSEVEA